MLVQQGAVEEQKDGMEMGVAIIDKGKKHLQFAGANNRLFLIRNSSKLTGKEPVWEESEVVNDALLIDYKGDRQPIGFYWEETKFTNHRIELMEQDTIYVFTDGFMDQFGGEKRKKFKIHRFRKLLQSVYKEPMHTQKLLLEKAFNSWRGDIEQTDDLCVIGVRI
jgi:hypothetical protein